MIVSAPIRARRRGGLGNVPLGWQRYREQVVQRHGNGAYVIDLQPLSGLRGLGSAPIGPTVLATAAPIAVTAASAAGAFAAAGAAAGPIGAGIGALIGIIAGAWAAHDARAKGATTENAAVNSAVIAFDASVQAVFAAANSGQVTGSQAAGACTTILQSYWQGMAPYQVGAGRADASHGGSNCGGTTLVPGGCSLVGGLPCNSSCTAGCCVGCGDLMPTILQAIAVFNSPTGGTITACTVYGSKYGANQRSSYTLTYTPPAASTPAGAVNAVSSLASSTVAGLPLWMLVAAGVGVYLVARR
jgi:hypothetical protein